MTQVSARYSGMSGMDKAGYAAMRKTVSRWPDRVWAVEGSNGAGRPLAQRLLADGEPVVAVRTAGLRVLAYDEEELEALRMLVDRRDEPTAIQVQTVNRPPGCCPSSPRGRRRRI